MELNSKEVFDALKSKGAQFLYHANTVQTACIFLQNARLLSRGTVAERGIVQTSQLSDEIDQKYGIWNDVFLDSVDIHSRGKRRNVYGPVTFEFDLSILESKWLPSVWVTKMNPTKWKDSDKLTERFFQSIDEFKSIYQLGDFCSMFILRCAGGVLRLEPSLSQIIVDDPNWDTDEINVYSHTVGALLASAWQGGITNPKISRRVCGPNCNCAGEYASIYSEHTVTNSAAHQKVKQFFFLDSAP